MNINVQTATQLQNMSFLFTKALLQQLSASLVEKTQPASFLLLPQCFVVEVGEVQNEVFID
jgi:hypothetical protein